MAMYVPSEDRIHPIPGHVSAIHGYVNPIRRHASAFDEHLNRVLRGVATCARRARVPGGQRDVGAHGQTNVGGRMSPVTRSKVVSDDAVRFGAIVNRLRTERHWTLEDLARFSRMNSTYLGVLERGLNMPTLATILRLAAVFGVDAAGIVSEVEGA